MDALISDAGVFSFDDVMRRAEALGPEPVSLVAAPNVDAVLTAQAALARGALLLPSHPRWTEAERIAYDSRGREARDAAVVLATSGSSGEPKLVVLDRSMLVASAEASARNLGWRADDRWLLCLPFAHVGGLSVITRCLFARRPVVVVPRFDPEAVLDTVARHRVTLLSVVPTMLHALLERDRAGALSRTRAVLVGGAACEPALRVEARERGVPIVTSYGLTEAASQVATQSPSVEQDPRSTDSGQPLPGVELRVVEGRIAVRGPMLMRGYLGQAPLEPGAFFETGDLGSVDGHGRLHVSGRADDMIVTGGENVQPSEVERVLLATPGVRAALVFGVPDPRWGELVAVALVMEERASVTEALETACRELASYKRPRRVTRVAALPLTAIGKPDRQRARRELADRLEAI